MKHFHCYSKKSITVFFVSVVCLSAVAEYLICKCRYMWAYPVLMWMPAVSAVIASVVAIKEAGEPLSLKKLFSNMGFRFCKIRYVFAGILLPVVYLLIPYAIYWRMHPENFAYAGVPLLLILKDCLPAGIIGIFIGLLTATGEEIGWRGFLVPALREKIGLNKTLLITGLFWCLWHFPLLIWGGYMEGGSLLYSLIAFVLCIFPVGVICGLLAIQSGSVWPCAFLHAAHNNYDQSILNIITKGADKTYYVGETGIFTIVCVWIIATILYISFQKMLIKTKRLIITEFTPDMAQAVQENSVDEDNRRFVPDEVWETTEEAEETLRFLISQYGSFDGPLVYPIILKETKENIGYVQLCPMDNGNWEIGYHIAKKYTGNGYATEAVQAFLPVIARQVNISEIYGICLAENEASLAVMRKCGFENLFTGIGLYQGAEREIVKNVWKA